MLSGRRRIVHPARGGVVDDVASSRGINKGFQCVPCRGVMHRLRRRWVWGAGLLCCFCLCVWIVLTWKWTHDLDRRQPFAHVKTDMSALHTVERPTSSLKPHVEAQRHERLLARLAAAESAAWTSWSNVPNDKMPDSSILPALLLDSPKELVRTLRSTTLTSKSLTAPLFVLGVCRAVRVSTEWMSVGRENRGALRMELENPRGLAREFASRVEEAMRMEEGAEKGSVVEEMVWMAARGCRRSLLASFELEGELEEEDTSNNNVGGILRKGIAAGDVVGVTVALCFAPTGGRWDRSIREAGVWASKKLESEAMTPVGFARVGEKTDIYRVLGWKRGIVSNPDTNSVEVLVGQQALLHCGLHRAGKGGDAWVAEGADWTIRRVRQRRGAESGLGEHFGGEQEALCPTVISAHPSSPATAGTDQVDSGRVGRTIPTNTPLERVAAVGAWAKSSLPSALVYFPQGGGPALECAGAMGYFSAHDRYKSTAPSTETPLYREPWNVENIAAQAVQLSDTLDRINPSQTPLPSSPNNNPPQNSKPSLVPAQICSPDHLVRGVPPPEAAWATEHSAHVATQQGVHQCCERAPEPAGLRGNTPSLTNIDDKLFECDGGVTKLECSRINDDLCDCRDGTDEPGTSACAALQAHFFCPSGVRVPYTDQETDSSRFHSPKAIFPPSSQFANPNPFTQHGFISSSKVDDGICDCINGEDEVDSGCVDANSKQPRSKASLKNFVNRMFDPETWLQAGGGS